MNKLSSYLLGFILGCVLMSSIFMGHYNQWQSFGPILGTALSSLGAVICGAIAGDVDLK